MKIRKITPWLVSAPQPYMESAGEPAGAVRPYLFVQLETDEGVTGLGSVFTHLKAEINWHRMFHDLVDDFDEKKLARRQKKTLSAFDIPLA